LTNLSEGFIWSDNPTGDRMDAQLFEAMEERADSRTVYDVPRGQLWGGKITGYLFAKSVAAGAFLAGWTSQLLMDNDEWPPLTSIYAGIGLLFLMITGAFLVADLKRPGRFWKILVRPNWSSWLARGTYLIVGYSALLVVWACLPFLPVDPSDGLYFLLGWVTCAMAALTACYTGWLFAQAKGRVLWMKRGYWAHLIVQAFVAGSAMIMVVFGLAGGDGSEEMRNLGSVLIVSLFVHYLFIRGEARMAPPQREEEYSRAVRLITHGPFRSRHLMSVVVGVVIPVMLIGFNEWIGLPHTQPIAGAFALAGLWIEKDTFVRAGQALPIS
jgi:formate-dependent nitrite reductase membrane component NrfD